MCWIISRKCGNAVVFQSVRPYWSLLPLQPASRLMFLKPWDCSPEERMASDCARIFCSFITVLDGTIVCSLKVLQPKNGFCPTPFTCPFAEQMNEAHNKAQAAILANFGMGLASMSPIAKLPGRRTFETRDSFLSAPLRPPRLSNHLS